MLSHLIHRDEFNSAIKSKCNIFDNFSMSDDKMAEQMDCAVRAYQEYAWIKTKHKKRFITCYK